MFGGGLAIPQHFVCFLLILPSDLLLLFSFVHSEGHVLLALRDDADENPFLLYSLIYPAPSFTHVHLLFISTLSLEEPQAHVSSSL